MGPCGEGVTNTQENHESCHRKVPLSTLCDGKAALTETFGTRPDCANDKGHSISVQWRCHRRPSGRLPVQASFGQGFRVTPGAQR